MRDRRQDTRQHQNLSLVQGKILGAGIGSFIAGAFLLVAAFAEFHFGYSTIPPAALVILCGIVLYRALTRRSKSYVVFLGLFGFMSGLLLLTSEAKILPNGLGAFWPLFVFFSGICLIGSGFYGKRRLGISYMIPAVLLIILGMVFLLFSTNTIQETLASFAARWLPLGLILSGIVLVALFFSRSAIAGATAALLDDVDDFDNHRGAEDD
ncbi:MAG: hypothetical protein LBR23_01180 [Spirochaetaceae bacterium]|jgi:hypothetical protein|nr:hypothetical protein [Spirochaetaceae bacterium]